MKATLVFLCNNGRHLSLEHLFSPLVVIYRAFFIIISKPICGGKSPYLSTCQSLDFPLIFVMQQQSSLGSKARITTVFKIHRPRKWHHSSPFLLLHTVRNLHFLSKNSTLISRENCRLFGGEKLVKVLWFWTF